MNHPFDTDSPISEARTQELLAGLEHSQAVDLQQVRSTATLPVKATVEIRSADACSRASVLAQGQTSDLQRHGVSCVLTQPVLPGSVFHLSFDRSILNLEPQMAVCNRTSMLSDTAFESHFRFVREIDPPIDMPQQ